MNFYIGILMFLVVIFGFVLGIKEIFKFKFGKSLFYVNMIIMFFMIVFSILDILDIGRYILMFTSFSLLLYFIIMSIKRRENIFKYFMNIPFFSFVIGLVVIVLAARKVDILMGWDECSYWATMVKRLFYFDSYLAFDNFHPMYYPPALTSYNYFVVEFLGMQDRSIYFAQYFLILSSLIYFVKDVKLKNIFNGIGQVLVILLFLVLLLNPYILTLYSEIPLILIGAIACLNIVIYNNKIDILFAAIMIFNFTLIKSNGIVLSLLPIFICFFQLFNMYIDEVKDVKKNIKNLFCKLFDVLKNNYHLVIVLVSSILAYIVFDIYLSINNISNPQSLPVSLGDSVKMFLQSFIYKQDIVNSYFGALSSNYNYSNFNISSIVLIIIFILGFILLKKYNHNEEFIKKNKYIEYAYIISFVIYAISLLYSYCCMFSPGEAKVLASYDRYINTFLGAAGLCLIGLLFYLKNKKNYDSKITVYLLLILLAVVNFNSVCSFVYNILPFTGTSTNESIIFAKETAEKYYDYFDENDKIHLIIDGDYGMTTYATIYYMTPLKMYDPRFDGDNWSIRTPESIERENTVVMSSDNYFKYLNNEEFTHVLVVKTSEDFSSQYNDIFETTNGLIVEGIYEINYDENKIEFRK